MRKRSLLCRQVVGQRVRLLKTVETRSGHSFNVGRVMRCDGTYRGRFSLKTLRRPKRAVAGLSESAVYFGHAITGVSRRDFEVIL